MVVTSSRCGTFLIIEVPDPTILAAIIGKTAFFAPDAVTVPLSAFPPLMTIFSMI